MGKEARIEQIKYDLMYQRKFKESYISLLYERMNNHPNWRWERVYLQVSDLNLAVEVRKDDIQFHSTDELKALGINNAFDLATMVEDKSPKFINEGIVIQKEKILFRLDHFFLVRKENGFGLHSEIMKNEKLVYDLKTHRFMQNNKIIFPSKVQGFNKEVLNLRRKESLYQPLKHLSTADLEAMNDLRPYFENPSVDAFNRFNQLIFNLEGKDYEIRTLFFYMIDELLTLSAMIHEKK